MRTVCCRRLRPVVMGWDDVASGKIVALPAVNVTALNSPHPYMAVKSPIVQSCVKSQAPEACIPPKYKPTCMILQGITSGIGHAFKVSYLSCCHLLSIFKNMTRDSPSFSVSPSNALPRDYQGVLYCTNPDEHLMAQKIATAVMTRTM